MTDKRYQIFISSTYEDLIDERAEVTKAILKMNHFPIGMEYFHADNNESWVQIKKYIDTSDYYVVIIGRYCGTLIKSKGISYTEREYDYAKSKGVPILCFVILDEAMKPSFGEETPDQRNAFSKFKKKVEKKHVVYWKTPEGLAQSVVTGLTHKMRENNRMGWIRTQARMIMTTKLSKVLEGKYDLYYFTSFPSDKIRLIKSELIIKSDGEAILLNNINDGKKPEYTYKGACLYGNESIQICLKNEHSNEYLFLSMINSAGKLNRFVGSMLGMSPAMAPMACKIACFKQETSVHEVNFDVLKQLLTKIENRIYQNHYLTIEEKEKNTFFSDLIFQDVE